MMEKILYGTIMLYLYVLYNNSSRRINVKVEVKHVKYRPVDYQARGIKVDHCLSLSLLLLS